MRFGSRGVNEFFFLAVSNTSPRCFDRDSLTEKAWEDALQGLINSDFIAEMLSEI